MRTETSVMRFTLTIDCDNAAFGDTKAERFRETAKILRDVAGRVGREGYGEGRVLDVNGNAVGRFGFEE